MTDYDDQPVISMDDVYAAIAKWMGRMLGVALFCFLAGYIWGSL